MPRGRNSGLRKPAPAAAPVAKKPVTVVKKAVAPVAAKKTVATTKPVTKVKPKPAPVEEEESLEEILEEGEEGTEEEVTEEEVTEEEGVEEEGTEEVSEEETTEEEAGSGDEDDQALGEGGGMPDEIKSAIVALLDAVWVRLMCA